MIAAALPAVADTTEPIKPTRAPKGVPFAAAVAAVPAAAAPDQATDAADKNDAATEPAAAPIFDRAGAPTVVADATALIAQLCPLPVSTGSSAAGADPAPQACHSRESGDPAPTTEVDSGVREKDTVVAGKALARPGKPTRQAGKAATSRAESTSETATKPIETPVAIVAQSARVAAAPAPVDPSAAAPLADVAITHHIDLAQDAQWLDRLAQDIARSADRNANLRFSLAPEHLGRLTVELAAGADGTAVRLTTESEAAHRIVSDAQPRLVAEARAQGLRISETVVDLDQRQSEQQQQPSPDGQPSQDRARPAVLWNESPQRAGATAKRAPAARDLYA